MIILQYHELFSGWQQQQPCWDTLVLSAWKKFHDIVILSFCNIVKNQANCVEKTWSKCSLCFSSMIKNVFAGAVNTFWGFWFISIFIFLISIYSTWIFAHEFHTCGLCWQSHRNDKTYSPASSDFGISTKSLKAHWSRPVPLLGRLTLAHSDPWGAVPVVVLTNSIGIHPSSWKYSSFGCQYIQVVLPEKKF